jgi:hypothetical protein
LDQADDLSHNADDYVLVHGHHDLFIVAGGLLNLAPLTQGRLKLPAFGYQHVMRKGSLATFPQPLGLVCGYPLVLCLFQFQRPFPLAHNVSPFGSALFGLATDMISTIESMAALTGLSIRRNFLRGVPCLVISTWRELHPACRYSVSSKGEELHPFGFPVCQSHLTAGRFAVTNDRPSCFWFVIKM